jgi:hypothetical protein
MSFGMQKFLFRTIAPAFVVLSTSILRMSGTHSHHFHPVPLLVSPHTHSCYQPSTVSGDCCWGTPLRDRDMTCRPVTTPTTQKRGSEGAVIQALPCNSRTSSLEFKPFKALPKCHLCEQRKFGCRFQGSFKQIFFKSLMSQPNRLQGTWYKFWNCHFQIPDGSRDPTISSSLQQSSHSWWHRPQIGELPWLNLDPFFNDSMGMGCSRMLARKFYSRSC